MTDCKYWRESWGKSFAGRCSAPDNVTTNASNNKWCTSPQTCSYLLNQSYVDESQMTNCNYSEHAKIQREKIQKQIEELQTALKLLEIEENRRTPCEKAYRDAYGYFPITDSMSGGDKDYIAWDAFQKGWEASKKYHNKYFVIANSKKEKVMGNLKTSLQELADGDVRPIDDVMEEVKKSQENEWEVDVKTNLKPHWESKKQEPKTLWGRFYDAKWSDSACDEFCEIVEKWLPKPIEETCGLSENDADWNRGYNTYREYLMMQLK